MSEIPYITISANGADAFDFLQSQLTADLGKLRGEQATDSLLSAWCSPKGRVICMPELVAVGDGFHLSLPADLADTVVRRLEMFRFRARVEFAIHSRDTHDTGAALEKLCRGVPEIALLQSEKFTPHMLNLDLLGVVSLDKGCYPGQEIVARTHYRGASKRRLHRYSSDWPVAAGDKVSLGDREVGEVVNAINTDLLAVVPIDSAKEPLTVGGAFLSHHDLPYLP